MLNTKKINNILLTGVLTGLACGANAADTKDATAATQTDTTQDTMTVLSPKV